MSTQERIASLLLLWQEQQSQGNGLSAAELCRDCPELERELREQIGILQHMNGLLGTPEASGSRTMDQAELVMVEPIDAEVASEGPEATGVYLPTQPEPTVAPAPTRDGGTRIEEQALRQASQVPGYETVKELGRGGMGVVYLARQNRLNRLVALKMVLAGGHARSDELKRFRTEAEAVARLQHPHIVQVFEVGDHEGLPFFSLEFCPGGSLDRKLAGSPLPPDEAAKLVEMLARAMQAAHQANVIHRDLKPANVLLSADGTPKITDFGLARKLDEVGQTQTGSVMGTPSYMAPEQAEGRKAVGPAADIYALGAILYECLTGRPPFKADTLYDTVLQVIHQEPVPPWQLNAKVPGDLETICLKCLQKAAGRRYASAQELAEDLQRYRAGEPIRARRVGRLERTWRWCKRYPAVAALLVLALAFGGTMFGLFGQARALRQNEARERQAAETARDVAEKHKQDLEDEKKQTTDLLYATRINLAYREWQGANLVQVQRLLEDCPPTLRGWEWNFLNGLREDSSLPLRGHSHFLHGIGLTPDGSRAVTLAADGTTRVWDAHTGIELVRLPVDAIRLAISPDSRRLALTTQKSGQLYDLASGRQLQERDVGDVVCGLAYVRDGAEVAAVTLGGEVYFLDAETGAERSRLGRRITLDRSTKAMLKQGRGVVFSPDGRRLAQGGLAGEVRVWDTATGEQVLDVSGHLMAVGQVAFSPDSRRLASPGGEGDIRVWDLESKQAVLHLKGHTAAVLTVAFSPDGRRLVSGSKDMTLRVWDLELGESLMTPRGHASEIWGVAFADGDRVASASPDVTARVWDVRPHVIYGEHGRELFRQKRLADPATRGSQDGLTLRDTLKPVFALAFSPDGRLAATAALGEGTISLWDLPGRRELRRLTVTKDRLYRPTFSPDGQHLVVGSGGYHKNEPAEVSLFEVETGRRLWHRDNGPLCVDIQPTFSPDGVRLGATTEANTGENVLITWEAKRGTELLHQKLGGIPHTRATWSEDGTELVTAGRTTGLVEVYDAQTGKLRQTWEASPTGLTDAVCGPNGLVATAAPESDARVIIKLWGLSDRRERRALEGHVGAVTTLAFSPDGQRLLSAGSDLTVRLWHTGSGRELLTLREHRDAAVAVAWSRDGSRIGSAGRDGLVKIWTAPTAAAPPRTDDWPILYQADFSSDGPAKSWIPEVNSSWEVRSGSLRGRQAKLAVKGVVEFPCAQALLTGVELPRTVEVRFAYRADRPLVVGAVLADPDRQRLYLPLLCGGPVPYGKPCAKLMLYTEGVKISYLGVDRPFTMQPGRWHHVRVLREPERIRVLVDGAEILTERIADIELTQLALQGSYGAVGEEIEFKELEIRAPAHAIREQKVRTRVRELFAQLLLPAEVRRRLEADPDLTDAEWPLVERLTAALTENPDQLEHASRETTSRADRPASDYQLALLQAEAARRAEPDNSKFLGTLAWAQYRAGQFTEAIAAMQRALDRTRSERGTGYPSQYAVLALAHHRLGHADSAREQLGRMRDLLWSDHWSDDPQTRAALVEAEKTLGDAARPVNGEEEAIKRLVTRAEQDGWLRHDLAAYLAAHAEDVKVRDGRSEQPGPHDVLLNRRQLEELRRLDFCGPPASAEYFTSYEKLHVELRGDRAELRCQSVAHLGKDYLRFGALYRLQRQQRGWRIQEVHSWLIAEQKEGKQRHYTAATWAELDAAADKLADSTDLPARIQALRQARRHAEAYSLAVRIAEQKDAPAAAWVERGDIAHDLGRVAEARDAFARACRLDPDVELPWYMTRQRLAYHGHGGSTAGLDFHPDGRRVLSTGKDKLGRIWEAATGRDIHQLAGSEGEVFCGAFSPDGRLVATASTSVRFWDAESGRQIRVCEGHTAIVYRLAFSSDGARLVTASKDGTARVWDVATGRQLLLLQGHTDRVLGAVFSSNGRFIATASHDKTARLWDAATGAEIRSYRGHTGVLARVVFSPDGRTLVTTGGDRTTRFWDVNSGAQVEKLQGHEHLIEVVLYSPDGRLLATADVGGVIRIWDAATRKRLYLLRGHRGPIYALAFRPDSQLLGAAGEEGVTLWDVSPEASAPEGQGADAGGSSPR